MNMIQVGKFIATLRKEHDFTQEQLGEELGVTNKTISRWETGVYLPPVDTLLKMSEIFGVSNNEMLSGKRLTDSEYRKAAEQNRPFPILFTDLQHRHVRNNDLNGFRCVPTASYLVREDMTFFSGRFVCVLSGFGAYPGLLAALMGQMVRKYPSRLVKNVFGQAVVTVGRMLFMGILKKFCQENTILLIAV